MKLLLGLLLLPNLAFAEADLYRWSASPQQEIKESSMLRQTMDEAYNDPEYLIRNTIEFPVAPAARENYTLSLSLREAILIALRYNPSVLNAEINRIIQRYDLRQAENAFELQYHLRGDYSYNHTKIGSQPSTSTSQLNMQSDVSIKLPAGGTLSSSIPTSFDGNKFQPKANLSLVLPLLRGAGATIAQAELNAAYESERSNILTLKKNIIDAVTNVTTTYRKLIQSNKNLDIAIRSLEESEKELAETKLKIKAGLAAPFTLDEKETNTLRRRLSLLETEDAHLQAQQALSTLLGLDPTLSIQVPNDVPVNNPQVPDLKATMDYALKHNINYQQQLINHEQSKRRLMLSLDAARIDLNLTLTSELFSTGKQPDAVPPILSNQLSHTRGVKVAFDIPIDDYAKRSAIIAARIKLEQSRINLAATERELRTEIRKKITSLRFQVETLKISQKSAVLSRKAYENELHRQAAGLSAPINVTQAQDRWIKSQRSVVSDKIAYLNLVTDLEQLLATTLDKWDIELRYA